MVKRILFIITLVIASFQLEAQVLKPLGQGVADEVIATTTDNNFLYVATRHNNGGVGKGYTILVNKWNGFYWQLLPGIGFSDSSQVKCIAVYKNQVYLAGNFVVKSPASILTKTIVRFNQSNNTWESVLVNGSLGFSFLGGSFGAINCMAVYRNQLFIAGAFYTMVNGDTTQNMVTYNGTNFSKCGAGTLGNTGTNGVVNSLYVLNDSLFLGGSFTKAGSLTALNLAAIDSNFSYKSFAISSTVGIAKITSFQNNLVLLTQDAQNKIINRVGNTFNLLNANLTNSQVNDIEEFNGELWACGSFFSGSSSVIRYTNSWSSAGLPLVSGYDLIKFRAGLYIVTSNDFAGAFRINRLAQILFATSRISGHVYQDLNHNCKFDNTDRPFANKQIRVGVSDFFNVLTDSDGFYSVTVPTGSVAYNISLLKFKNWEIDSPCTKSSYSILSTSNATIDTLDFGLKPVGSGADLKVRITPNNGYTSHRDMMEVYTISYTNNGTQDLSSAAGIKVVFNNKLANFSSTQNFVLNGNEASWAISNLKVGEEKRITFTVKAKADSFSLYDKISFVASSALADLDASDNSDTLVQRIAQGSNSPVTKNVYPLPAVNDTMSLVTASKNEISYVIHFENTSSTDSIHNIIVIDTIDINSSIQFLEETGASHSYTVKAYSCPPALGKGVIVWTFSNINLPPNEGNDDVSNRGHVGFKIKFNSNLPLGTVIKNKADVVFDYYEPIKTNNTYSKVANALIGIDNNIIKNPSKLLLCSNPVHGTIHLFNEASAISNYKIFNSAGACVQEGIASSKFIDVSMLATGIYYLQITSENQLNSQKIIVQ